MKPSCYLSFWYFSNHTTVGKTIMYFGNYASQSHFWKSTKFCNFAAKTNRGSLPPPYILAPFPSSGTLRVSALNVPNAMMLTAPTLEPPHTLGHAALIWDTSIDRPSGPYLSRKVSEYSKSDCCDMGSRSNTEITLTRLKLRWKYLWMKVKK